MSDETIGRWMPGPPGDNLKTGEQVLVVFPVHEPPLHLVQWVDGAWRGVDGDAARERAIRFHARVILPSRSDA